MIPKISLIGSFQKHLFQKVDLKVEKVELKKKVYRIWLKLTWNV